MSFLPEDIGMSNTRAALALAALVFGSHGAGLLILRNLKWRSRAHMNMAGLVLGMDIFCLLVFLNMLGGFFAPTAILSLPLAAAAAFSMFHMLKIGGPRLFAQIGWPLGALLAVFSAMTLCYGLTPPVGWDELTYHISVPVRWIRDSWPHVYLDNPYSGFPSMPEALNTWLLQTGGLSAPKLLNCFLLAFSSAALYLLTRPGLSKIMAAGTAAAFLFAPSVFMLARETFVETFLLANLAGVLLIQAGLGRPAALGGLGAWAAAGICAGAAAAVKLNGAVVSAATLLCLTLRRLFSRGGVSAAAAFMFLAASAVFAFPFYLRPCLATGNPFHPFFASFFNLDEAAREVAAYHHAAAFEKFGNMTVCGFFSNPFLMDFIPDVFDGSFGLQLIVMLALAGAGLALAAKRRDKRALAMFATLLCLYAGWFFSSQQARFLAPAFFVCALVAGGTLRAFDGRVRICAAALILTATVISFPSIALKHSLVCWKQVFGVIGEADLIYTGTGPGHLHAAMELGRLGPKAKALMLFDHRGLYIPCKYEAGTPFFQSRHFRRPWNDMRGCLDGLRKEGFTHITTGLTRQNPDMLPSYSDRLNEFAAKISEMEASGLIRRIWEREGHAIFEISDKNGTFPKRD